MRAAEFVLIVSLVALGPLSTDLYLPSLPAIATDLHAAAGPVQLTLSLFLLGFAGGQLVLGPLSDRFGRRPVLLAGLLIYVGATVACALASSIGALLAARLLAAVGACAGPVLGRAIVRDLFGPDQIARMLSYIGSAMSLAPIAGPPLGGALAARFGWRGCFCFLLLIALVQLLAVLLLLRESHHARDHGATSPGRILANFRAFLRARAFLGNALCASATYSIIFAFISGSSFVLQLQFGLGPVAYGMAFGITVFGYFLGNLHSGRQTRRRPEALLQFGTWLALAATLAMAVAWWLGQFSAPLLIALMFCCFVGIGLSFPNALAGALAPYADRAGAASSLLGCAQMVLASTVGALVGVAYGAFPGPAPMVLAMLGCAGLALLGARVASGADSGQQVGEISK